MSETSPEVREAFSHPKLKELPDQAVTLSTLRSVVDLFHSFTPEQITNVQAFIRKSIDGPTRGSLGAFGKGEAAATYALLRDKVDLTMLTELDHKLEQGGDTFRFPLAVVRSLLHHKRPYQGFEDTRVDVSENIVDFSLCPDAEGHLYSAMQIGGAALVTREEKPFMLAKLEKTFGKSVALPLHSAGPFVEGVFYSPGVQQGDETKPVRHEITNEDRTVSFDDLADVWLIGRPVTGNVPPIPSPFVPEQDALQYFHDNSPKYPFPVNSHLDFDEY